MGKKQTTAPARQESKVESWTKTIVQLAVVVIVALAARSSLADHYVIPSGSMLPTLDIRDRVFVAKSSYGLRVPFTSAIVAGEELPARGDVAVFRSPTDGSVFIKRVVALPGDTIRVSRGRIYINGKPTRWEKQGGWTRELLDDRRYTLRLDDGGGPDQASVTVPDDSCFVMGDNRGNSQDSRAWGFLPLRNLRGKAIAIYWRSGEGFAWDPLYEDLAAGGVDEEPDAGADPPVSDEPPPAAAPRPGASNEREPTPAPEKAADQTPTTDPAARSTAD